MSEGQDPVELAGEGDEQFAALLKAQKAAKTRALLGGAAAVVALGGIVFAATRGSDEAKVKEPEPPSEREVIEARFETSFGADWLKVIDLTKIYDAEPCDAGNALDLIDTLINHRGYKATIDLVDVYLKDCGPSRNIQWKRLHANKMLERYDEAIKDGDSLVHEVPTDSDFWWWRGELHHKAGHFEQAIHDYWQSAANRMNSAAAKRMSWIPDDTGKYHCSAAFLLRSYIDTSSPEHPSWDTSFRDAYVAGGCDAKTGKGTTKIKIAAGDPMPTAKLSLEASGNASADALLSEQTAMTIVTQKFADEAGLAASATEIEVRVAGAFKKGKLATATKLSLGKASAAEVPVVVVDTLPGELQAVLGANYLWRFKPELDKKGLTLSAW